MSVIHYSNQSFNMQDGESVLDTLLREGQEVSYSCQAGICQSCIMVCDDGDVPDHAQKGLKESQKELNYFLSCQCKPDGPMKVAAPDQDKLIVPGQVTKKAWLNDHVVQLRLKVDLGFKAGQFVNLWKDEHIGRSYSIASLPSEKEIECHIKVIENGAFSEWLKDEVKEGQTLGVQGPMGLCFYQGQTEKPLLLAAIGTGLAPILGILRDALSRQHAGQIDLVVGAKYLTGFYLVDELLRLEQTTSNLNLHLVCEHDVSDTVQQGNVYDTIKALDLDWKNLEAYICGAESFVKKLKKQVFLSGAAMSAIHADSFISS